MHVRSFLVLVAVLAGCDALSSGPPALSDTDYWSGSVAPQFADFNGDGRLDAFGWVYDPFAAETRRIAAFDGATGRRLWRTPDLDALADASDARIGLVGGRLIAVDAGGRAQALDPGADAVLWTVELGELAAQVCSGAAGEVIVTTKDGRAQAIDVARGTARPATAPAECRSDATPPAAAMRTSESKWEDIHAEFAAKDAGRERPPALELEGMAIEGVLRVAPALQVALAEKRPGTPAPMLAAVRDGQVVWTNPVAAEDPLRARFGIDAIAAADEQTAFVLYEQAYALRIAAFAIADGARLWDVAVTGGPPRVLLPVQERLYVVLPAAVAVLDRATGELRHTIGPRG